MASPRPVRPVGYPTVPPAPADPARRPGRARVRTRRRTRRRAVRARRRRPAPSGNPGRPSTGPPDRPEGPSPARPPRPVDQSTGAPRRPGTGPGHAAPDAEAERDRRRGPAPPRRPAARPDRRRVLAPTPRRRPSRRPRRPAGSGPPTPAAPDRARSKPTPVRGLPLASTFPASAVTASESVPVSEDKKPIFAWSRPRRRLGRGRPAPGARADRARRTALADARGGHRRRDRAADRDRRAPAVQPHARPSSRSRCGSPPWRCSSWACCPSSS